MEKSKYLTVRETARYVKFCESIIRQWIKRNDFYPCIRVGKRIVIDREALDCWLQEQNKSTKEGVKNE